MDQRIKIFNGRIITPFRIIPKGTVVISGNKIEEVGEGNVEVPGAGDGLKVIVEDGVAKLPDRSSFAGSVATADRLVRTMVTIADVPLIDAVRMISKTPASILGILNRKGALVRGPDADMVLFDDDIKVA